MAHYALQKLHILPSVFVNLPLKEKAFVYASTLAKIQEEKKETRKIKLKRGRRR